MYISNQSFLVLGVSKSGYAAAKHIIKNNGKCYLFEQLESPTINSNIEELNRLGAILVDKSNVEKIVDEIDVLVISPGVPINHEVAVMAKRKGKRIIGELEFGYLQSLPCIIAVTGTNGKTTTCTMINDLIKENNQESFLIGNVGKPFTSEVDNITNTSVCVTEVSSFQLESVNSFCPHISCVLNIAPDHLERHYTMENYVFLKKRIFKNQKQSEYTLLNYDDEMVKEFASETNGKVVWVSTKQKVDGAYLQDGILYFKEDPVINVSDLPVGGLHNVYNALFTISVGVILGIKKEVIEKSLKNFKGIKHRIELILEKDGVKYYDDSKATNVASTLTALSSMQNPTLLILGGSEKGENYDELFSKVKSMRVKHVILTGDSKYHMLESAGRVGWTELTLTPDFDYAVKIASLIANEGDNVLLSPACASFDKFSNFEERGDRFSAIVRGLN